MNGSVPAFRHAYDQTIWGSEWVPMWTYGSYLNTVWAMGMAVLISLLSGNFLSLTVSKKAIILHMCNHACQSGLKSWVVVYPDFKTRGCGF